MPNGSQGVGARVPWAKGEGLKVLWVWLHSAHVVGACGCCDLLPVVGQRSAVNGQRSTPLVALPPAIAAPALLSWWEPSEATVDSTARNCGGLRGIVGLTGLAAGALPHKYCKISVPSHKWICGARGALQTTAMHWHSPLLCTVSSCSSCSPSVRRPVGQSACANANAPHLL